MIFPSYFLMSLRYLQAANKNSTIRTMMQICCGGIFLGTFSLALIISIMKGFEEATYLKMQTIYPQIIIDAHGQEINYEQIKPILQDPAYSIKNFSPQLIGQALCNTNESDDMPQVIQIKGIDPQREQQVTPLHTLLLPKNQLHYLDRLIAHNQVIIGKQLALQLHLSTGSPLNIIYTQHENLGKKIDFEQKKVIVTGIFETGIDDFDSCFIYCSSALFNEIFPDRGVTQIYANLTSKNNEDSIIEKLQNRLKLNIYSWKKLYAPLVSALELEKYAMFIILLLIVLVASSNIISLLFMLITQKRKDIALLLTLGLSHYKIRNIFLIVSMSITSVSAFLGLIGAYLVGIALEHYRWIKLPDNIYYTSHLPIMLDPYLFLFIFFVVLSISFIASLLPLYKIKTMDIATIVRNEI